MMLGVAVTTEDHALRELFLCLHRIAIRQISGIQRKTLSRGVAVMKVKSGLHTHYEEAHTVFIAPGRVELAITRPYEGRRHP